MDKQRLISVARSLVAPAKGILAADESTGTIKRRFDSIGVECTEDNRRDYRELLFRTQEIGSYISGVILFDATIRQADADGTPLVSILSDQGIIPGIKVDTGAKPLAGAPGETVTEGLDGLRERLKEYEAIGAGFTKWRAVINIGPDIQSFLVKHQNHPDFEVKITIKESLNELKKQIIRLPPKDFKPPKVLLPRVPINH